ncbi:MAG TPA: FecR domain-containing protein [Gallionella sp.]|nr:FecR domain-containing protein [Gallionella sp.]
MNKQRWSLMLPLILTGWCVVTDVWSAQAGRVQFVHGEVRVSDQAGRVQPLQKGDAINEGDTLISASNASAQIKMMDGGFVAVRPDTRLKFDSFKFSGKAGEPESSFFSLFKGGFRAITGLIGRLNKQDYRITTPSATIGIRGTDHETVVVVPDSPLVLAGQAASGTYNKVNAGETSLTTDKGSINVLPNQMGFAGGQNQMPKIQPINLNLFTVAPSPAPGAAMEGGDADAARESAVVDNTAVAAAGDATTVAAAGSATVLPASVAPPPVMVTLTQNLLPPFPTQLAGGLGFFYQDTAGGVWTTGGGGVAQVTPSASGGLGSFATSATFTSCIANCNYSIPFQSGSLGTASLLDQGSNILAGNLHWGRWFGQGATVVGLPAGDVLFNGNLTYIGGDIPTMPISGAATYLPVGGTSPVDSAGNAGKFIGANVSVNFTNLSIAVSNMQLAFGGNTYTMAGAGTFLSSGVIPSVPLAGSCAGTCTVGTAMNGDYAGSFTGVNAAGLALVYHVASSGLATNAVPVFEIMGSQAFIKQ